MCRRTHRYANEPAHVVDGLAGMKLATLSTVSGTAPGSAIAAISSKCSRYDLFPSASMRTPSPDRSHSAELTSDLRAALRAALWTHRESLDTLRDAICAFTVDLHGKGVPTAQIAAAVRDVVSELTASGERLAAELAHADPGLDQTVRWCLEFGAGPQSRSHQDDSRNGG